MSTTPRTDAQTLAYRTEDGSELIYASTARELETELTAAKAECDLNRTRLASIFWSGAMDNYTGGDVQKWAANYTAELARLRAASRYQARAEKAEAELAAESERVRVLLDAIKNCIDYANGNKYGWEDRVEGAFSYLYEALAATKEASK